MRAHSMEMIAHPLLATANAELLYPSATAHSRLSYFAVAISNFTQPPPSSRRSKSLLASP